MQQAACHADGYRAQFLGAAEQDHAHKADDTTGSGVHHGGGVAKEEAGKQDLQHHEEQGAGNIQQVEGEQQNAVAQTQLHAGQPGHGQAAFHKAQDQHQAEQQAHEGDALGLLTGLLHGTASSRTMVLPSWPEGISSTISLWGRQMIWPPKGRNSSTSREASP